MKTDLPGYTLFLTQYNQHVKDAAGMDTTAKLKAFWQFAIEQGIAHPGVRSDIAQKCITSKFKVITDLATLLRKQDSYLTGAFIDFGEFAEAVAKDPAVSDRRWAVLARKVASIDPDIHDSIPKDFLEQFLSIWRGQEKLTSIKQLKAFWLSGCRAGDDKGYETRACIASMMMDVAPPEFVYLNHNCHNAYIEIESFAPVIYDPSKDDEKIYAENGWQSVKYSVERL